MNIQKQIDYWVIGSGEDLDTAKILIERNRILHGLFFCHLTLEKSIKALVVKETLQIAPKSHNLFYLSELAKVEFNEDDQIFLGIMMKYQLHGRYPDYNPHIPSKETVQEYLLETERIRSWLRRKL